MNDELIWSIVNHQFCSFKAKVAETRTFCRNTDNVTGQCDRRSCPLANSRYATVKEENGRAVLYVKTAERAHTPKTLWEKTTLSRNYAEALEKLDSELEYWPKFLMHKCKQRLTKIHQVLIRMRKLRKEGGPLLEPISQKDERRERVREDKALRAAKLEKSIESELLERLKQGTYGEIYNYPSSAYEKALKEADAQYEDELLESDDGEEDVEQRTEFFEGDLSEDDEADGEDVEDYWKEPPASKPAAKKRPAAAPPAAASTKKPKRPPGPYVEIEYETEPEKGMTVQNW